MPAVSSLWRSPDYTSADRVRTVARITATQTALPQALKEPLQEVRRATFPGPATRKTPTEAPSVAVLGASALDPTLTRAGYLTQVANHPHRLAAAALLYLVAGGASVGIAIALYPVVKRV